MNQTTGLMSHRLNCFEARGPSTSGGNKIKFHQKCNIASVAVATLFCPRTSSGKKRNISYNNGDLDPLLNIQLTFITSMFYLSQFV